MPSITRRPAPARPSMRFLPALALALSISPLTRAYVEGDPPPADYTPPPSHSPAESLQLIHVAPGYKVELVASEPLIADPVAFDWDHRGRLYVVQMNDYPLGIDGRGTPGGRVQLLHDDDGDGVYDRADPFLEGLNYPTAVKTWRNGILVTAAPDLFYAEDTDGDGRADKREVLYTGFTEGNQQHRINGLRWGLDGWLYLANGDSGGVVRSIKTGAVVDIRNMDVRIKPDEGLIETIEGRTQFGRNRDDFGNWFGGMNSNPMWHYVLPQRYLERNPHVSYPSVHRDVSIAPGPSPVYPASSTESRFNDPDRVNRFTSACSHEIVRETRLGDLHGDALICEPVHNLIRREHMERDGVSFKSTPAAGPEIGEFFASQDLWTRPVMVRTGPDGAIYVADMYRQVIEHPEWIPAAWQKVMDLRAGSDMGRIYRVTPEAGVPDRITQIDVSNAEELVALIASPNGWVRDKAHEALVQLAGVTANARAMETLDGYLHGITPLSTWPVQPGPVRMSIRAFSRGPDQIFRPQHVQAWHLLQQLGRFSDAHLKGAVFISGNDSVRTQAVAMLADRINEIQLPDEAIHYFHDTPDLAFRLQSAFTLGEWKDPRAGAALGHILIENAADEYLVAAAMSSAVPHTLEMMKIVAPAATQPDSGRTLAEPLQKLIQTAVAIGDAEAVALAVDTIFPPGVTLDEPWRLSILAALIESTGHAGRLTELTGPDRAARIASLLDSARATITDPSADEAARNLAVTILARRPETRSTDIQLLSSLIAPSEPLGVQRAAIGRLAEIDREDVADALFAAFGAAGPAARSAIFEALVARGHWAARTLQNLKRRPDLAASLGPSQKERLLNHSWMNIRQLAGEVFTDSLDADRAAVVERYAAAGELKADAARGRVLFEQSCAACHRIGEVGNAVGPDLTALSEYSTASLLTAILNPNAAVEDKFQSYVISLDDGRTMLGMIASESGGTIEVVTSDGQSRTLTRRSIVNLVPTGRSLMIEGLEAAMDEQSAADLMGFLRESAGRGGGG